MAYNVSFLIPMPGPLTAIQERQYFNNVKNAKEMDLPVVLPTTNLVEKYNISDPLLARLVDVSTVFLACVTYKRKGTLFLRPPILTIQLTTNHEKHLRC